MKRYSIYHRSQHLQTLSIDDVLVDSVTNKVYHVEQRPDEEGRNVIVDTAALKDVFGQGYNARYSTDHYRSRSI